MKKKTALLLLLGLLICLWGTAGAEWKQAEMNAYRNVASPGTTFTPTYSIDYSNHFGVTYTKDMFDITYSTTEYDVTVDEITGEVTLGKNALCKDTIINITYTRKGNPKMTKTFDYTIYVVNPLKKMTLSTDVLYLPNTKEKTSIIVSTYGAEKQWTVVDYMLYDDAMIKYDRILTRDTDPLSFEVLFTPQAAGETYLKFVSYNGIVEVLPIHVVDNVKQLTFGIDHVVCKPGDVIDLGIDLGNGEYGRKAYASKINTMTYRDGAYYAGPGWFSSNRFVTERGGEYELRMSMRGFPDAVATITVYDDVACADIELSADLSDWSVKSAEILAYDAEGNRIQRPMGVSISNWCASEKNDVITKSSSNGTVTVTVTNPDGSTYAETFEVYSGPSSAFITGVPSNLKVGDVFEVGVGYSDGREYPYELSYRCWNYDSNGPEPIRMEGNTVYVQAIGQAVIVGEGGGNTAQHNLYIKAGEKVTLEFSRPRTAVGQAVQAYVVNEENLILPATFSGNAEEVSITADGLCTPLKAGTIIITATTGDGRTMSRSFSVTSVPQSMTAKAVTLKEGGTAMFEGVKALPDGVSSWALTVSVEDPSIATFDAATNTFKGISPGTTQGYVHFRYADVTATFPIEVVASELYIGSTTLEIPYGFSAYLPVVTDGANEVPVTWTITQEQLAAGNPNASAFLLEDNMITCLWPEGSCIVTGVTKDGGTVKVKVSAYRIAEMISISPAELTVELGGSADVKIVNEDPGTEIPAVYWAADQENIIGCKTVVEGKLTNTVHGKMVGTALLVAVLDNGAYATCTVTVVDPMPRIPGDANDDGAVDAKDALLIMQYVAGWNLSINGYLADVNADGKVTVEDAILIFQHDSGLDVELKQYIPAP